VVSEVATTRQEGADEIAVRDNPERSRYEATVGPVLAGHATYHRQPGIVTVLHSEVDPAFEGRGVGSVLVRGMLDDIRTRDAKVLAICPFVRAFLQRHDEYSDLVWKP
jgi:predicted GNAT family acetyltransferase